MNMQLKNTQNISINQSVYCAQGSTIKYRKNTESRVHIFSQSFSNSTAPIKMLLKLSDFFHEYISH